MGHYFMFWHGGVVHEIPMASSPLIYKSSGDGEDAVGTSPGNGEFSPSVPPEVLTLFGTTHFLHAQSMHTGI